MSIKLSRVIVRFMAVVTLVACCSFITFLFVMFYGEFFRVQGKILAFLILLSVLPVVFIWQSVRAWRYVPKGIESLSVIWALTGIAVLFYGLIFGSLEGWDIQFIITTVIGFFVFFCGFWMTKQQKKLYDVA